MINRYKSHREKNSEVKCSEELGGIPKEIRLPALHFAGRTPDQDEL